VRAFAAFIVVCGCSSEPSVVASDAGDGGAEVPLYVDAANAIRCGSGPWVTHIFKFLGTRLPVRGLSGLRVHSTACPEQLAVSDDAGRVRLMHTYDTHYTFILEHPLVGPTPQAFGEFTALSSVSDQIFYIATFPAPEALDLKLPAMVVDPVVDQREACADFRGSRYWIDGAKTHYFDISWIDNPEPFVAPTQGIFIDGLVAGTSPVVHAEKPDGTCLLQPYGGLWTLHMTPAKLLPGHIHHTFVWTHAAQLDAGVTD
jgi:hypothetical protein